MKLTDSLFLSIPLIFTLLFSDAFTGTGAQKYNIREVSIENDNTVFNDPPIAVNDTFIFAHYNSESHFNRKFI